MKRSASARQGKRGKLGDLGADAAQAAGWRARMRDRVPRPSPSETSPRLPPAQCQRELHLLRKSRDGSRLRPAGPRCSTADPPRRLQPPSAGPGRGERQARLRGRLPPPPGTGSGAASQPCRGAAGPASTWDDEGFPLPCAPTPHLSSLFCLTPAGTARPALPGADTSLGGGRCAELSRAGGRWLRRLLSAPRGSGRRPCA